jgi:beta-phosphoglucomutase-like phosphatase (HAD superfamily)
MRRAYARTLLAALALVLAALACAHAPLAGADGAAGPARLEDVLARAEKAKTGGRPVLAIFDIDGTILDPAARTRDIFVAALDGPNAVVSPEHPELAQKVRALPLESIPYAPESTLALAGIRDTAWVRALVTRWSQDFFSNRYLLRDTAIPGAVAYLDSLHARGVTIVYFTGRDAPRMLGGTAASLLDRGFPVGIAGTMLILKPDKSVPDFDYKKNALDEVARYGTVVGVFENEPRNINLLHERFPESLAFYIDTKHSPNAPPVQPGITRLPDFLGFKPR